MTCNETFNKHVKAFLDGKHAVCRLFKTTLNH